MLDTGGPAPDFMLSDIENPDATYMLSAAANEGPVVLAFAPPPATAARDLFDALDRIDWGSLIDRIAVFGICDSEAVAEGCAGRGYPFPILVDGTGYVADLYELASESGQAVVLADTNCTIAYAWEAADSSVDPPLEALQSAVAGLEK